MSITFNIPLGTWHMANYSFVISHAVGLEETSEKPAEPQQYNRKKGEECKPCESKMRIRNSVDIQKFSSYSEKIFQKIMTGLPKVIFGLTLRGTEGNGGERREKNWRREEAIIVPNVFS